MPSTSHWNMKKKGEKKKVHSVYINRIVVVLARVPWYIEAQTHPSLSLVLCILDIYIAQYTKIKHRYV